MKRFAMMFVIALVSIGLTVLTSSPVSARPEYKAKVEEMTKNAKGHEAIKEAKCNVCHYGKTKKNRNDFGQALNKHMDEEAYKKLKEDKEVLGKKVEEALKAALKEKSKDGKTFGELIEAGSLPAQNPAE